MVVLKKEDAISLVERAVADALKKGADEAEVFLYQGFTTRVSVERGQITKSAKIIDEGLGIRVVVKKALGFSYTNKLDSERAVEETILNALGFARASKPYEDWYGFSEKKQYPTVEGTFDKRIVELSSEDLVNFASRMLDAAKETDKRVLPIEGEAGAAHISMAIANSNGVEGFDSGTVIECSLATVGREGSETTPICFEYNIERNYDVDPNWVGKEAAKLAVSALKARKAETKRTSIIFTQFALHQLLYYTLINAVKADYVQRNQSFFKDKIGKNVASEKVTIVDDGLLKGGLATWKFDGEGVPQQKTKIIEKGILKNFIYDNYTAKKEGKESTGNASRAGYLSTPNIEATNFHFIPGEKTPEKLINEIKEGLIVHYLQGAHSSNPASGEFSVVATPAWKIKNGEIVHAVKGVMLAGNVFDLLLNVSMLANNERKIGRLVAPWVLVENVKVIGS